MIDTYELYPKNEHVYLLGAHDLKVFVSSLFNLIGE